MAKRKQTPIQQAIAKLFEIANCSATPEQMLEVANEFEVEVWALEGLYLDAVDKLANE